MIQINARKIERKQSLRGTTGLGFISRLPFIDKMCGEKDCRESQVRHCEAGSTTPYVGARDDSLDNSKVQFVGDLAVFVNEEEVLAELKNVTDKLLEHPNNTVYVVGSTASGDLVIPYLN